MGASGDGFPKMRVRRRGSSGRGFGHAIGEGSRIIANRTTYKSTIGITCKITIIIACGGTTKITHGIPRDVKRRISIKITS